MKLPCEEAIWYTLPKIRADIAKELVKSGMSQKEVADKMEITPSAVSQYLSKKRGNQMKMPADYDKLLKKAALEIKESGDMEVIQQILCRCCAGTRSNVSAEKHP